MAKEFLSRTGYLPIDPNAVVNLTGPVTSVGNATSISPSINLPGSPTTTTATPGDDSTKIATTEFVTDAIAAAIPGIVTLEVYNEFPTGVIDGINTVYTTVNDFEPDTTRLYLNGIRQRLGADYLETGLNEITFDEPPVVLDGLIIDYVKDI